MNSQSRLRLGAGLAAAAVSGVVLFGASRPSPQAPAAAARSPSPVALPPRAAQAPCQFERDAKLAYSMTVKSSTTQAVPQAPAPVTFDMGLFANAEFQVLAAKPQSAVLVARFSKLTQQGGTGLDITKLATPFLVEVDANCQLIQFARHRDAPLGASRKQQALLWDTQFRAVATSDFQMQNSNGVAVGTVEQVGPGQYRRALHTYTSLWATNRKSATHALLGVTLGKGPWFESLASEERFESDDAQTQAQISLEVLPTHSFAFTDAERTVENYVWENLLPQSRSSLVQRPVDSYDVARRQKVAHLTVTQAVDAFVARVQRGAGVQNTWPELAAYFEANPDALRPAVQRYLRGELPPTAAGDFFLAMGKTRTDEAREQLLEIKRNDTGIMMDQVRAMFALVTREDVGPDLARELGADVTRHRAKRTQEGNFLASESALALGMMSGTQDNPAVTEVAKAALTSTLSSADEPLVRRSTLAAMGNTGEPSLLPAALPFMNSPDVSTRKDAAEVFLRMPPADSEPLQIAWLQRESSPFVKNKLYAIAQQQHLNLNVGASRAFVNQAMSDLKSMQSPRTRRSIVRLLAQSAVSTEPDVRTALKNQAKFERAAKSPLLNEFASHLTRDEIAEVLR